VFCGPLALPVLVNVAMLEPVALRGRVSFPIFLQSAEPPSTGFSREAALPALAAQRAHCRVDECLDRTENDHHPGAISRSRTARRG
jgi:hypothetical protein